MALTKTVSKTSVTQRMPKLFSVAVTLTITDDDGPGFMKPFSRDYKTGTKIPRAIADFKASLKAEMQAAIDKYKAERAIFQHAQFDTLVAELQSELEVG